MLREGKENCINKPTCMWARSETEDGDLCRADPRWLYSNLWPCGGICGTLDTLMQGCRSHPCPELAAPRGRLQPMWVLVGCTRDVDTPAAIPIACVASTVATDCQSMVLALGAGLERSWAGEGSSKAAWHGTCPFRPSPWPSPWRTCGISMDGRL